MLVIQNDNRNFRGFWLVLLVTSLAFLPAFSDAARADFIPGFPDAPGGSESATNIDITNYGLTVAYDASTHVFSASTSVGYDYDMFINDGNIPLDSGTGDLSLSVTIDPSTGNLLGGTFSISGDANGGNTGNLLTGTIYQFGFAPSTGLTSAQNNASSEHFQFIFTTTGGDLAAYYPSLAVNMTAVNLVANGGNFITDGTFASSFGDTSANAQTDTYAGPAVPEPASLTLGCAGLLALAASFGIRRGTRRRFWSPLS